MYSLPNILTISRIVVIPVIFLSIYIHSLWWTVVSGVLFILAAVTDYFDGYLARSRNETSVFGRLLDPIADKLLVVSALLIIVANRLVDEVSYIPVGIIMCREVLVSGLREFLAEVKVGMPVTRLAKWKTGFQMTALAMILLSRIWVVNLFGEDVMVWGFLGEVLLWVAGVLTFITGYDYFQKSLDYVRGVEKSKNTSAKVPAAKKITGQVKSPAKAKKTPKKKTPAKKVSSVKKAAK